MSVPAELANRMDWSLTPWTPDTAPNYVSSGTNSLGNEFIKFDGRLQGHFLEECTNVL